MIAECAHEFDSSPEPIREAVQRLADAHMLVLQRDTLEILMANPFSAVPTPFLVETKNYSCYGNCIWDALGIPAMLHQDARIKTACGDCGTAMEINIVNVEPVERAGIIHFALPALRWWEDIVFN